MSWSPDGRKLVGILRKADGGENGLGIYSLESGKLERLVDFGDRPAWLGDSRRLLFQDGSKLYLIDTQSRKPREILSLPHTIDEPSPSRDGRLIYFSAVTREGDIWLATLE